MWALPFPLLAATAIFHVVDPSGKPVANATVYVQVGYDDSTAKKFTTDQAGQASDDLGSSPGKTLICVIDAPGYAPNGGVAKSGDNLFSLLAPMQVTGKVVDTAGQPVAGAIVKAEIAETPSPLPRGESSRYCSLQDDALKGRYTVKTDSDGKYKIDDLSSTSVIVINLDDPRYVESSVSTASGSTVAPPLVAAQCATITGKVVRQDGKPLGSIIHIQAEPEQRSTGYIVGHYCQTAPDGSYTITRLAPGGYRILTTIPRKLSDSIAPPMDVSIEAKLGTVNTVPDIVLPIGGTVTGSILDADTKKPVPGVQLTIYDNSSFPSSHLIGLITGADGTFTANVWTGKAIVSPYLVPDIYVSDLAAAIRHVTVTEGQVVTLAPILLERAPTVQGVATDDSGKALSNIQIQPQGVERSRWALPYPATSGADGAFNLRQLKPGSYWIDPGAAWNVASPKTFTVPMSSPLKVVLRRAVVTELKGTVVDTSGAPVAGANLVFSTTRELLGGYQTNNQNEAATDQSGRYSLSDVSTNPKMVQWKSCTIAGYAYRSGGETKAANGQLSITPIVMEQLGGKVSGIVYNSVNKPVEGAWVYSLDSGPAAVPVQTDAAGHFSLTGLTNGPVKIYAAKGLFSGVLTTQSSSAPANAVLHLAAAAAPVLGSSDLKLAVKMLTDNLNLQNVAPGAPGGSWFYDDPAYVIASVSLDAAVSFILPVASVNTDDLEFVVRGRLALDPVGTAQWALVPIKKMSGPYGRGKAAVYIGLAVAPYDRSAALPYYDIAAQNIHFVNLDDNSIFAAMQLTALAYALDKPEADDDYAKVSAAFTSLTAKASRDQSPPDMSEWQPQDFAAILAQGNPKLAIKLLGALPPEKCYNTVQSIVAALARPNPSAAVDFYQILAGYKDDQYKDWPEGRALCDILPILYKSDPESVLKQAHGVNQIQMRSQALTILADLMPMASAAPLYEEAEADAPSNVSASFSPACIAHHAWLRDKSLGIKLYKKASDKFNDLVSAGYSAVNGPSSADFGFYYSPIDPAYSRMIIERRFAYDNSQNGQYFGKDGTIADCCAMAAIDINRASEMARSITDGNTRYSAGVKIAQYVLFTPEQRQTLPFASWGQPMDWTPGTEGN